MGMSPEQLAAIDRLKNKYNGSGYNASTNPGGLADGGHRVNFEPALQDTATAGEAVAEQAEEAAEYATAVRRIGTFFLFDDGTSDADPGAGEFRFNHATISSATSIFIDIETAAGTDAADWIATWDDSDSVVRGELTFIHASDPEIWAKFQITGANTVASGYRKVTVTYVDHAGTFVDEEEFSVAFSRAGDKGQIGLTGVIREQFSMDLGTPGGSALTADFIGIYPLDRSVGSEGTMTRVFIEIVEGAGSVSGRLLVNGASASSIYTATNGAPVNQTGLAIAIPLYASIDFEITEVSGAPVWAWIKTDGVPA